MVLGFFGVFLSTYKQKTHIIYKKKDTQLPLRFTLDQED